MSPRSASSHSPYDTARAHDQQLRDEHAALVGERNLFLRAPEPHDTIVATMHAMITASADAYAAKYGDDIVRAFSRRLELRHEKLGEYLQGIRRQKVVSRGPQMFKLPFEPGRQTGQMFLDDAIGLLPELIADRFEEIIRATEYEAGPPVAERLPRLAALDAEIRRVEDEHAALVDEAAAFDPPLQIALLPAVVARRKDEAQQAEDAQRQQALLERANSAHATARYRGELGFERGASRYIESGGELLP